MSNQVIVRGRAHREFIRLHRMFVEHLAYATTLAWAAALIASWYAPWVGDIRALMGLGGRPESTATYLFGLPIMMALALFTVARFPEVLRRSAVSKNQTLEFALAGAIAFLAFGLSVRHAVMAYTLG